MNYVLNLYSKDKSNHQENKENLHEKLLTFTVINSDVLNMNVECEGGQLLNINDRWYFYGDTWYNYGLYCYMQTEDITNFGYLIPNGLTGYRHGSVLYLEDREAINLITSIEDYNTASRIKETRRLILLRFTKQIQLFSV